MLLHHTQGATSYADLKRSPDGVIQTTFKETVIAFGLLESDEEWDECLAEASMSFMPKQLCSLFVTILIFGEPAKPLELWLKHKQMLGEDLQRQMSLCHEVLLDEHSRVDNEVLCLLNAELEGMGTCLEKFGLPTHDMHDRIQKIPKVIQDELFHVDSQRNVSELKCQSLNRDQQDAFHTVMKAVNDQNYPQRMFFLNAPGGYGKTFHIEALLYTVRAMGKIALAVASSGIAAELLEGGRTAHSQFKIPIPVNETSVCSIYLQSDDAKLLQKTDLIIWDEIMMSDADQVDCVDRSLRDILKIDKPFGEIPVVFGGDPRQILPIVHHGHRAQIVKSCIHSSQLWNQIQQIKLTTNMRVNKDEIDFSTYLLTFGDGTAEIYPEIGDDMVKVPKQYLVNTIDDLIHKVFPSIEKGYLDKYFVS